MPPWRSWLIVFSSSWLFAGWLPLLLMINFFRCNNRNRMPMKANFARTIGISDFAGLRFDAAGDTSSDALLDRTTSQLSAVSVCHSNVHFYGQDETSRLHVPYN